MSFKSSQDAENRLRTDITKLTPQDVRDTMEWMHPTDDEVGKRLWGENLA